MTSQNRSIDCAKKTRMLREFVEKHKLTGQAMNNDDLNELLKSAIDACWPEIDWWAENESGSLYRYLSKD